MPWLSLDLGSRSCLHGSLCVCGTQARHERSLDRCIHDQMFDLRTKQFLENIQRQSVEMQLELLNYFVPNM